jgi:hypothetical protein
MATKRISIFGAISPGTSGNVWPEPASITQTNDRYAGQPVLRFKDTGTKDTAAFRFLMPDDFVSAPVFRVIWTSTATSGAVVWTVDYNCAGETATMDPSADDENLSVTSTAPGTSQLGIAATVNATAANFAANQLVQGNLARNGASGSDTMAADAVVYDVQLEYSTT